MKLALFVAFATLAIAASYNPQVHSVVYKPGEQYVYHYKGQILSGVPRSTKQFSGLVIDSLVLLQFQQDHKVVMKLENMKLFKVDDKVTVHLAESVSVSDMIRLTGEQEKLIMEKLVLPIKFSYDEGEIRDIHKEQRDPYWSVNIKKGVLTLLQVTLKEKHSLGSESPMYYDPTMSRIKSYSSRNYGSSSSSSSYWNVAPKTNSVFTVKETDVTGSCETKYTIISDKTHLSSSSSVMHVSAVRNFENCASKPFHIQGIFQGAYSSQHEKDLIQPVVHTDYVISGDRSHFLIKEVKSHSKYQIFVNGLEGGDLASFIKQTLKLKDVKGIRSPIHLQSPKMETRGLQMVIPKSSLVQEKDRNERAGGLQSWRSHGSGRKMERDFKISRSFDDEEMNDESNDEETSGRLVQIVEQKLQEMVTCLYKSSADSKCSEYLKEIKKILKQANEEQLRTLYNRYSTYESTTTPTMQHKISEILLDVLPSLPNPEAAKVLIELIRERKVSSLKGSLLINAMSLLVKPTPSTVKHTLELFKEQPKETTTQTLSGKALLRQSCLLAVGTLTNRLITIMRNQGKPQPEVISFVDSISMELKRMLEEKSSDSEKILVLKAMGNMGASENIMVLKSVVEDRREDQNVRKSAVFALRRLAKEFKKQVIPILMGVYMDVKEQGELRQAAFIVIIKSNPTYTTLQMIAHRVLDDPSSQVRTLVYTNLVNLAYYTSHQPEHKTLVKNSRLILKTLPPVDVSPYDSMSVFLNKFSETLDAGVGLDITKIKSKMSGLPEALIANLQGTLFGKHRRLLEVGVEGKSVEVLLKKVFGPHGLLQKAIKGQINLEDILKPIIRADLGGIEHKIVEIMNKMRRELPTQDEPLAKWYIRVLGNEIQYLLLNTENVKELSNKAMLYIPELLIKLKNGVNFDVVKAASIHSSVTVTTPIGIPLSLNLTLDALFKAEASVKVDNLPTDIWSVIEPYRRLTLSQSWSEFRRQPINIPELKLNVVVKPVVDVTKYVKFGADLRWIGAGVGVKSYLKIDRPFRVSAELNKPQHSVSLKYFPTKQTTPALHAKILPFAFFSYASNTRDILTCAYDFKELQNDEIVKSRPFQLRLQNSLEGLEYDIQGQYSLCGPNWCPIMPLFGKQEITISTRPTSDVEFVEMKVKCQGNNFEFEGLPSHLSPEQLYEDLEDENDYEQQESRNYRTSSRRSASSSDEFEPVQPDQIFQGEQPIKRQLRVVIRSSNRQATPIKAQLTWFMARNFLVNQVNAQVLRSAHSGMSQWKVVVDNVINPKVWCPLEEQQYIGSRGEYLTKTVLAVNFRDQMKVFKLKVIPGSPFDFSEELAEQSILPVDDLPRAEAQKYKYTIEVDFPEIRNYQVMKALSMVQDFIKYNAYDKLASVVPHSPQDKKLIISVELLPWWEKMNVIVKSPREDLYITDVPFYWNPFHSTDKKIKLHNIYSWSHYKRITPDDTEDFLETLPYHKTPLIPSGQCSYSVETGRLVTFDSVHLPLDSLPLFSQSSCSFVLAQHCTREGLFSVILKGDHSTPKIKVLLPKHEVELVIQSSRQVVVFVNGEPKTIHESKEVIINDQYSESRVELYKIAKHGSTLYKLEARDLGLEVILNTEVKDIKIKLSPASMLQGELCGACGNSDFDARNDMYTSRDFSEDKRDYTEFIKSSLIPSESCSLQTIRPKSQEYCKKTSHVTLRRYDNDQPMTCRTEREVVQCAKGCRPAQTRSVKTCFRCESLTNNSRASASYYQPASVWELEDSGLSCQEFSERLEIPTTCEPAYWIRQG